MRLNRIRPLLAATLLAFLIGLFPGTNQPSAAATVSGPHFTDIIVTTSDTHLLLFGELRNSLTDDMITGLHSGIPIEFTFFVELEKVNPNWLDDGLSEISFSHGLSYDTIKQVYTVQTQEISRKTHSVPSLDEAKRLLNEINGLEIVKLEDLEPDRTYRLRVKADLNRKTLPMNLHALIPFVSWWDFKTDWYTIEFIY